MSVSQLKSFQRWEELKWRANWYNMAGTMLEIYFKKHNIEIINKEEWHNYHSLDFFPGYYFLNCMF